MLWQVAAKFNNIDDPKKPFWFTYITDGDTKEDAIYHVAERIANQEPLALVFSSNRSRFKWKGM